MKTTIKMPKMIIVFMIFMISIINIAEGQTQTFGIQTTFSGSNVRVINNSDLSTSMALTFGINGFIAFQGNGNTGFSVEPGYMQKGCFKKYSSNSTDEDPRLNLGYLSMPVLINFGLKNRFTINTGMEFGYLMRARHKIIGALDVLHTYHNRLEISALIGVTYNAHDNLDLALRFSYGLTPTINDVIVDQNANYIGETKEFNITPLQFILRYKLKH